jgi:uncharacterized protein
MGRWQSRSRECIAEMMVAAVRCYQAILRPLTAGSCRYVPGCSEYFIEAVRIHGPWRGMILGGKRILRCRPGGDWGYDPVPPAAASGKTSEAGVRTQRPTCPPQEAMHEQ